MKNYFIVNIHIHFLAHFRGNSFLLLPSQHSLWWLDMNKLAILFHETFVAQEVPLKITFKIQTNATCNKMKKVSFQPRNTFGVRIKIDMKNSWKLNKKIYSCPFGDKKLKSNKKTIFKRNCLRRKLKSKHHRKDFNKIFSDNKK